MDVGLELHEPCHGAAALDFIAEAFQLPRDGLLIHLLHLFFCYCNRSRWRSPQLFAVVVHSESLADSFAVTHRSALAASSSTSAVTE
jgi:hypothetical protein